ncbi:MAG TPA: hypothetical protein VE988_02080 [Gemmataceae bacterium]|nr:hypothetical protein [Gemmataceae bacterium]
MNAKCRFRLSECRYLLVLLALAGAGHVLAGADPIDDRVAELQRNEELIGSLVEGGLQLAAEDDPLQRATYCNQMVDKLSGEINLAMKANDPGRAAELGGHMHEMMVKGVAVNLGNARAALEPNSPREPEIARIADKATASAKKIEDEIFRQKLIEPAKMKGTVQGLAKGRNEIEKAMSSKAKAKAKDKGKKGKI